jgi:hypothetical protein
MKIRKELGVEKDGLVVQNNSLNRPVPGAGRLARWGDPRDDTGKKAHGGTGKKAHGGPRAFLVLGEIPA